MMLDDITRFRCGQCGMVVEFVIAVYGRRLEGFDACRPGTGRIV